MLICIFFQKYKEESIDWVWNSIIKCIIQTLFRACKNDRKDWKNRFSNISKLIVQQNIICFNLQRKNNKTVKLNLSIDLTSFDTRKRNGKCPSWIFDAILNSGNVLIVKRTSDNTIFRYYQCYIIYRSNTGVLIFGGKLKHKTLNVHHHWQK